MRWQRWLFVVLVVAGCSEAALSAPPSVNLPPREEDRDGDGAPGDAAGESDASDAALSTTTYCTSSASDFCEDFDRPPQIDPRTRWARSQINGAALVRAEDKALVAGIVPADAGDTYNVGWLWFEKDWGKKADGTRKTITVRSRLFVEVCPADSAPVAPFGMLAGVDRAPFYRFAVQFALVITNGVCTFRAVAEIGAYADAGIAGTAASGGPVNAPVNSWFDVEMKIVESSMKTDNFDVSIAVNNELPSVASFKAVADIDLFSIPIGVARFGPAETPARYRIDDFRVDYSQ